MLAVAGETDGAVSVARGADFVSTTDQPHDARLRSSIDEFARDVVRLRGRSRDTSASRADADGRDDEFLFNVSDDDVEDDLLSLDFEESVDEDFFASESFLAPAL